MHFDRNHIEKPMNAQAIPSYFAVIIQVLQPLDSHISDVAAAKQDFAWWRDGEWVTAQASPHESQYIYIFQSLPPLGNDMKTIYRLLGFNLIKRGERVCLFTRHTNTTESCSQVWQIFDKNRFGSKTETLEILLIFFHLSLSSFPHRSVSA